MRDRGWRKSNPSSHLFVGLVLIIVGVMSMMARLDMVYGLEILDRGWPLILIGFGFFKVSQSQTGAGRGGGLFWIAIGALFLASAEWLYPGQCVEPPVAGLDDLVRHFHGLAVPPWECTGSRFDVDGWRDGPLGRLRTPL